MSRTNEKTMEIIENACTKLKTSADKLREAAKELKDSQDLLQKALNKLGRAAASKLPPDPVPARVYKTSASKKGQPN
jgi:prefoldin subunit 5